MITAMMLLIMLMPLFTYVFGGALDPSGQYVDYVVPGIILLCAGFGSSSTAVDVSQDMTNGIIDRFRTMPIQSISVITGHVVASLARNMLATFVVIAVALLVGSGLGGTSGVDSCYRIDRALHLRLHLALCRHRPRCRQPRAAGAMDSPCSSSPTSPVPSFLPKRCRHGRKGRKQPADYAGHRVHSRVADGWVYSGSHRLGNRMVSVYPCRLYSMGHVDL